MYVRTDNAANVHKAITGDGCNPSLQKIRCFAYLINLAVQCSLKTLALLKILFHEETMVAHITRSPYANAMLKTRQAQLVLPAHKPINDAFTRWGSTLLMLKQFFEQKTAVYTALEALKNADLIKAVSSVDSDTLQNVIDVLKTFQTAKTVISKYSLCTISLILSLQLLLIT